MLLSSAWLKKSWYGTFLFILFILLFFFYDVRNGYIQNWAVSIKHIYFYPHKIRIQVQQVTLFNLEHNIKIFLNSKRELSCDKYLNSY